MSEGATQQEAGSQPEASETASVSFLDTLPEDIRGEPSLKNFTDTAALAKSYISAQNMIGKDKIPIPGQSATEEEWNEVYSKLGRPSQSADYNFKNVENFEEAGLEFFRDIAFANGLSAKQAEGIAKSLTEKTSEADQEYQTHTETLVNEGIAELEKEWGQAYDQKITLGLQAAKTLDAQQMLSNLVLQDGRKLGEVPEIIRLFVDLGGKLAEDNLIGEVDQSLPTPKKLQKEYEEITRKDGPYWDAKHPLHEKYVDQAQEINRQIYNEG